MTKKFFSFLILSAVLAACSGHELDGNALAQEKGCVSCHGIDGTATAASYPNLDGQWPRYLRLQLIAYRNGKRDNAIMNGMAP